MVGDWKEGRLGEERLSSSASLDCDALIATLDRSPVFRRFGGDSIVDELMHARFSVPRECNPAGVNNVVCTVCNYDLIVISPSPPNLLSFAHSNGVSFGGQALAPEGESRSFSPITLSSTIISHKPAPCLPFDPAAQGRSYPGPTRRSREPRQQGFCKHRQIRPGIPFFGILCCNPEHAISLSRSCTR